MAELWDVTGDRMRAPQHSVSRPMLATALARSLIVSNARLTVCACAVYTFTTILRSGNPDVIIAFAVFLPFALLASACSIAMNAWLLHKQLRTRLAHQRVPNNGHAAAASGPTVALPSRRRLTLAQLAVRFMLHTRQTALQERVSANDIELKQFCMSLLLLLTEVSSAPS
jgi:hypothetical protein